MKRIICFLFLFSVLLASFAQSENVYDTDSLLKSWGCDSILGDSLSLELKKEVKKRLEGQIIKEICGLKFGSSYEKATEFLKNKFGQAEYDFSHSKQKIIYNNIRYANIEFNKVFFLFQSDGLHSYMNGCIFSLYASDVEDAISKRDMLYKKLSDKYIIVELENKESAFKYYNGGSSPFGDAFEGFIIDIIKFSEDIAQDFNIAYCVRLTYGPYNYVKEDF